jgi:tetratricopeptide (TPR) repeat protein
MHWATTLAAWARRDAVLVSALAAGAAIAALAGPLGVAWLTLAGAIVAILGAVPRVVIAVRRARLEGEVERAQLGRLLRVDVTPIARVDPTLIGIDRAAEQAIFPGSRVPKYVPRAADDELREAVAGALDGSGAWVVVVHGPSKVGKSRSLFEALLECARRTPLDLVAPVDASALTSLLTPGEGRWRGSGAAVLWLDDLEPFLNGGVTWQTLREWRGGGPLRIVAATYGGKGSELIAGSRTSGLATILSEVLGQAREVSLQATTPSEVTELCQRLDAGEAASLEHHGLAAYLVAGPALERKLNTGRQAPGEDVCPEGVALVHAAVDWATCGRTDAIAENTLRQLWRHYLPQRTRVTDDGFERGLTWALEPVAGSIGLLQRAGSYQAFDYVVRLLNDKPDRPPVREEAWTAALASARDAQALAVATSAFIQRERIALDAFARARTSSVDEIAAAAGFSLGVVLGTLDRWTEAVAAYDDVVARFGDATEPALRRRIARALIEKGATLIELERFAEALAVYDDVVARFGDATDAELDEHVANAMVEKGATLGDLDRSEEELVIYDGVVARFGDATEPALREQVARAMVNKGITLGELDRSAEELAVYDDLVTRFGDASEPALCTQVARAMVLKAAVLGQLDRSEDEIRVYDDVVRRFGHARGGELLQQVARALVNKGITLGQLDRSEDEIRVYDDVVRRFGHASGGELLQQVARALVNKGATLGQLNRPAQAVAVYDDVVARFGDDTEPELRAQVAMALINKGAALVDLDRPAQAIAVYDNIVARFGDATEPELREVVDNAQSARRDADSPL